MGWAAIVAIVGALIGGLFSWIVQRSKSGTDIEVAAIGGGWEKLYAALSKRVTDLEQQLADVRSNHAREIEQIIRDHSEAMEALKANHREEMNEIRSYCAGLERQIAQHSQSTAVLLEGKADKPDGK